jgi:glycine/D-amino acid oxidase-like deaminating enzyme
MFSSILQMEASSSDHERKRVVIVGGGIQGVSVAYHLAQHNDESGMMIQYPITILEANDHVASAASGKGGGFMARSWGDGTVTQSLHELSFDLYEKIAPKIGCTSYRKIPVLSVSPSSQQTKRTSIANTMSPVVQRAIQSFGKEMIPSWLDDAGTNSIRKIDALGSGTDTAQVTPTEFVTKMLEHCGDKIQVILNAQVSGIKTATAEGGTDLQVKGVKYTNAISNENAVLPTDVVVVSAGPWSCVAEDWFGSKLELPMEGVKSTSIVYEAASTAVDAVGLFCGEHSTHGTHCKYVWVEFLIGPFI